MKIYHKTIDRCGCEIECKMVRVVIGDHELSRFAVTEAEFQIMLSSMTHVEFIQEN